MLLCRFLLSFVSLVLLCSSSSDDSRPFILKDQASKKIKMAYTIPLDSKELLPIDLETGKAGKPIVLDQPAKAFVISPNAKLGYVLEDKINQVTPIDLLTKVRGTPILLDHSPEAMVITSDSHKAYVISKETNEILAIDLGTNATKILLALDHLPSSLTLSADNTRLYVACENCSEVNSINLTSQSIESVIHLTEVPEFIATASEHQLACISKINPSKIDFYNLISGTLENSLTLEDPIQSLQVNLNEEVAYLAYQEGTRIASLDLKKIQLSEALDVNKIENFSLYPKQEVIASFTAKLAPIGEESLFDASNSTSFSGSGMSYIWNFGNGEIVESQIPLISHTFNGEGDYQVALQVKDSLKDFFEEENRRSQLIATTTGYFSVSKKSLTPSTGSATTTTLTSSGSPSAFSQLVTLTAVVTPVSPAAGYPTGTVAFFNEGTAIGVKTLNQGIATLPISTLSNGANTITAVYSGDATFEASDSLPLIQQVNPASTTTSLSSSSNPSIYGGSVTLTAIVTGAGTAAPTGSVTFKDGTTTLGIGTLVAGAGNSSTAIFSTSLLTGGSHAVSAVYNADPNYLNSTSSAITQTINKASPIITVTSSLNPSTYGQSITFNASVAGAGAAAPTGTVTFKDGTTTLATSPLVPGTTHQSTATFVTSALSGGSHAVTVVYNADGNYLTTTSPAINQVINKATPTVGITSNLNPSAYGQSVSFKASVTGSGSAVPTGTITFKDDGVDLGSPVTLSAGNATLTINTLVPGTHSITAQYNSDRNYATATSPNLTQTVDKATPTISLSSSNTPAAFGSVVTLTAILTSPTSLAPVTGTVDFKEGAATLGTGTLSPGPGANQSTATYTTTTFNAGTHPTLVAYSGDTYFKPVQSNTFSQIVNKAISTTTSIFSNSPNPSQFGQAVTLQATVTGSTLIAPFPPTGTITFRDANTIVGTATLSQVSANVSKATLIPLTNLTLGNHPLTADYSGDINYPASSSHTALNQVVIESNTTTVLTSSVNPSLFGQPVLLTALVAPISPGAGKPTGQVEFFNGPISLGLGTLVAGTNNSTATLSTTSLLLGSHQILAVYLGDHNFTSSTSNLLKQVVNKAATTVTLTSSVNPSNFGSPVTFTAKINVSSPSTTPPLPPTGFVSFYEGTTLLGTGTVTGLGQATFKINSLFPLSHTMTALYSGDSNFNASPISSPLEQNIINKLNTSIAILPNSCTNSSPINQPVTVQAKVLGLTIDPPYTVTPTGSVTFFDNGVPFGTSTLVNGLATCIEPGNRLSALGDHTITATYIPDPYFNASTSPASIQTVVPYTTATTVQITPHPSQQANATIVATIQVTNGLPTPYPNFVEANKVIFVDDQGASLGTASIVQTGNGVGTATIYPNNLHFGNRLITARFVGDSHFFASSCSNANAQVQQTAMLVTTTQLSSSQATSYFCEPVILKAVVSVKGTAEDGFYAPSGSVTFFDGTTALGTALLIPDSAPLPGSHSSTATIKVSDLPVGTHTLKATYNSDSNYAFSDSNTLTNQVVKLNNTSTVLSLIPSLATTPYGQPIGLIATVQTTTPGQAAPTGSITFADNSALLGTVELDQAGDATLLVYDLTVGAHTITATYNPDSCFNPSAASLNHTVKRSNPTTTFNSDPNPSIYGQTVNLYATVKVPFPGLIPPTGRVRFLNGPTTLGEVELADDGSALLQVSTLPAGNFIIEALYLGDSNYLSTSQSLSQEVKEASTAISLIISSPILSFGETNTYTALVEALSPGIGVPTGNVLFLDGSKVLGSVPLNSQGIATFTPTALALGLHSITARYDGEDTDFLGSTSTVKSQTIVAADTTTNVTTGVNPTTFGTAVQIRATVNAQTPGAGTPTGTVQFKWGAVTLGTATLVSGVANLTTSASALSVGTQTIIGIYTPDNPSQANFNPSTGLATQTVNVANTTTTLSSNPTSSVFGQTMTFTVNVAATPAISGFTPTGTVIISEGTTTLAVATLAGGSATFTTSTLSVGTHSIRATYTGSTNFNSSTSSLLSRTINKAAATTTLSGTPTTSVYGSPVTFNATVTPASPGAGTPTGSVTFRNGTTVLQTVNVNSVGQASFTSSTLLPGSYSMTATYNGDTNFSLASSSPLSGTVVKASTTLAMTSTPNPSAFGEPLILNALVSSLPESSGTGSEIPTGTVTFRDGTNVLGTATLNHLGQASLTTTTPLNAGHHLLLAASYSGDSKFLSSSSSNFSQTVQPAETTIVANSTLNPSNLNQAVNFDVTVSTLFPGAGTPTGSVTAQYGSAVYGPFTLDSNGHATIIIPAGPILAAGVLMPMIVYDPGANSNFNPSSTVVTQKIDQSVSTITLTSSPTPSVFGQAVTFKATSNAPTATGTITFYDGPIPLATVQLTGAPALFSTNILSVTAHSITAAYSGDSNFVPVTSNPLTQVVNKSPTLTTQSVSSFSFTVGQLVTVNVKVSAANPGSGVPTGTVTFKNGTTVLGTVNLNSLGEASFSTNSLLASIYNVTATYNGDTNFNLSETLTPTQLTINALSTATAVLSSTPNPSIVGDNVTFFASVASSFGIPTGKVNFSSGTVNLGTGTLFNGLASLSTPVLPVGLNTINATFIPDNTNFSSSSSPNYPQLVHPMAIVETTKTTVTSNHNPSIFGDPVTFHIAVRPFAGPSTPVPTGAVTLYYGSVFLSQLTLDSTGHASFVTAALPAGELEIVAIYAGDTNYSSSVDSVTQVVESFPTTMTVSSSLNPSTFSSSLTLTAHVAPTQVDPTQVAPFQAASKGPTGSVTFYDGAAALGTALLNSKGEAALTVSTLSVGSHTIEAVYHSDNNYSGSTQALVQVVDKAPTSTLILTSSPNPSRLGEAVTLVVAVTSNKGIPEGGVTFYSGTNRLGEAPLSNGLVVFQTSDFPLGTSSITAVYNGNTEFASSTTATSFFQTVLQKTGLPTTTQLTSSHTPSEKGQAARLRVEEGQAITFKVDVKSIFPGPSPLAQPSLSPTGTVTIFDGGYALATLLLDSQCCANFTTSDLKAGTHSMIAIYNGDHAFSSSTSPVLVQIVTQSLSPQPPIDFKGYQTCNEFLDATDIINVLTWNPPAEGTRPKEYKIFRDPELKDLVATISAKKPLIYEDHNRKKGKKYTYYILSINESGVSAFAKTSVGGKKS